MRKNARKKKKKDWEKVEREGKRRERKKQGVESRVTSIDIQDEDFPCPAASHPSSSFGRKGRAEEERKRARSGGLASCTRTHTPGSRVLQVARVTCVRDGARENLVTRIGYGFIFPSRLHNNVINYYFFLGEINSEKRINNINKYFFISSFLFYSVVDYISIKQCRIEKKINELKRELEILPFVRL